MGGFDALTNGPSRGDREARGAFKNGAMHGTHLVLSHEECLALLPASRVGHLAVSMEALPAILPVNYLTLDQSVWFRDVAESALLRAAIGSVVAFQTDGYDEAGSFGWSVLVRGVAEEVTDPRQIEVARSRWVSAWPLGDHADRYVIVPTTVITGWRYLDKA